MRKRTFGILFRLSLVVLAMLGCMVLARNFLNRILYPIKHRELIVRYAAENNLPPELVCGVIYTESRFRENAVSYANAKGLMQITEDTFEWAAWRMKDETTSYENIFDPETNIRYGCYILRLLKEEFGSDEVALAAYNAGWGNVKKWLADPRYSHNGIDIHNIPFTDTNRYIPDVKKAERIYQKLYFTS